MKLGSLRMEAHRSNELNVKLNVKHGESIELSWQTRRAVGYQAADDCEQLHGGKPH